MDVRLPVSDVGSFFAAHPNAIVGCCGFRVPTVAALDLLMEGVKQLCQIGAGVM